MFEVVAERILIVLFSDTGKIPSEGESVIALAVPVLNIKNITVKAIKVKNFFIVDWKLI